MPGLRDIPDHDLGGPPVERGRDARDELLLGISRNEADVGQRLELLRRHLGIASRHDDRRRGVAAGGPADQLPGLEIRPGRDRAGVHDADIGFRVEADQGVTHPPEGFRQARRFTLVDLTAKRHQRDSPGPVLPGAPFRDRPPTAFLHDPFRVGLVSRLAGRCHVPWSVESARFLNKQSRLRPEVCQDAIIVGYHNGIVIDSHKP